MVTSSIPVAGLAPLLRAGQRLLAGPFDEAVGEVLLHLVAEPPGRYAELVLDGTVIASAGVPVPATLVFPLSVDGEAAGELRVACTGRPDVASEQRYLAVADLVALALGKHRAERAAADIKARLVAEVEAERGALADELHDGVVQSAVATRYAVDLADRTGGLEQVRDAVQGLIADARGAIWDLRGRARDGRLVDALLVLAERLDGTVSVDVRAEGVPEVVEPARAALAYRLVQESVACAHAAGARAVEVRLEVVAGDLLLAVGDDGPGYPPSPDLRRWIERTSLVGGDAQIRDDTGATRLVAWLPRVAA